MRLYFTGINIHPVSRTGASYFRLVWPLRAFKCEYATGSGDILPQEKFYKLGTLRLLMKPCLGKNATRMSPSVVSVAREAIEPSCQNGPEMTAIRTTPMLAPSQFAQSSRAQVLP